MSKINSCDAKGITDDQYYAEIATGYMKMTDEFLNELETGKLVYVTRCNECMHHIEFNFYGDSGLCWCGRRNCVTNKNGYCDLAERNNNG